MKRVLITAILGYKKFISPWLGGHCRFYPSCSEWACQAIETYGVLQGLRITARRLLSCHPFHPGGYQSLDSIYG